MPGWTGYGFTGSDRSPEPGVPLAADGDWAVERRSRSPRCIAESTDETGEKAGEGEVDELAGAFVFDITNEPERSSSREEVGLERVVRMRGSCRISKYRRRSTDTNGRKGNIHCKCQH